MKLLLLLEHTFIIDENDNVWSETVIDYDYLKRYLEVFEELVLCARMKKVKNKADYKKYNMMVSGKNIYFAPLPYALSSKELITNILKIRKDFSRYVENADAVILRAPSLISLSLYDLCINKCTLGVEFVMGANEILSGKNFVRKIINKFFDYRAKKLCMKANGVAYVTEQVLQKKYPCHSLINGESAEYFDTNYSSLDLYTSDYSQRNWKIDQSPNEFCIIHIGGMQNDRKGQARLIDAAKKVLDDGYKIKIIFLGDGKEKENLKNRVKMLEIDKYVEFVGNINDRNLVFKYIRNSHLLVLPTSSEGLPRVIIECMANGLPCISSPVDGIPELLDSEYLVNYYDIDNIALSIEKMISNWEKMIELSAKNFEKAQHYRYDFLKEKRKSFYQKLKYASEVRSSIHEK